MIKLVFRHRFLLAAAVFALVVPGFTGGAFSQNQPSAEQIAADAKKKALEATSKISAEDVAKVDPSQFKTQSYGMEDMIMAECAALAMPIDPKTGQWKGDAKKFKMTEGGAEAMKECLRKKGYFTRHLPDGDKNTAGLRQMSIEGMETGDMSGLTGVAADGEDSLPQSAADSVSDSDNGASTRLPTPAPVVRKKIPPEQTAPEEPKGRKPGQLWVTPQNDKEE